MARIDAVLAASVDAVKKSGALEGNALMATVSALNTDGTVDLSRAGDTYPSVRLLSGYAFPQVGDTVEMLLSAGGWVCLGKLMTANPTPVGGVVDQRAGVVNITPSAANVPTSVTVTYPAVVGNSLVGLATAVTQFPGTSITGVAVTNVTATSMQVWLTRSNTTAVPVSWSVLGTR